MKMHPVNTFRKMVSFLRNSCFYVLAFLDSVQIFAFQLKSRIEYMHCLKSYIISMEDTNVGHMRNSVGVFLVMIHSNEIFYEHNEIRKL